MIDTIQVPIQKLAESPKASGSVMALSVRDNLPLSESIIQTLRILAHDATDSKKQLKKTEQKEVKK